MLKNVIKTLVVLSVVTCIMVLVPEQSFAQEIVNWECRIQSSNSGCTKTVEAPIGKKIVGVRAACNLEWGAVSNNQLESVPANTIKVIRKSDRRWLRPSGYCYVNNTKIFSGQRTIEGVSGISKIVVGCYEHDKNGGDCHIKGTLLLEEGVGFAPPPLPTNRSTIMLSARSWPISIQARGGCSGQINWTLTPIMLTGNSGIDTEQRIYQRYDVKQSSIGPRRFACYVNRIVVGLRTGRWKVAASTQNGWYTSCEVDLGSGGGFANFTLNYYHGCSTVPGQYPVQ